MADEPIEVVTRSRDPLVEGRSPGEGVDTYSLSYLNGQLIMLRQEQQLPIYTEKLNDGAVTTPKLIDKAITTPKIDDGAVTAPKVLDAAITTTKIADDSISTPKLQANSITTTKLAADSVTATKLAAIALDVGKYIRSTSYVAGVSGWAIDAAGTAEFNNVTVRGIFATGVSGARVVITASAAGFSGSPAIDLHTSYTGQYLPGVVGVSHTGTSNTDPNATARMFLSPATLTSIGLSPYIWLESREADGGGASIARIISDSVYLGPHTTAEALLNVDGEIHILGTANDNALVGDHGGQGGAIRCRTNHNITFEWTGTVIKFYIDNVFIAQLP